MRCRSCNRDNVDTVVRALSYGKKVIEEYSVLKVEKYCIENKDLFGDIAIIEVLDICPRCTKETLKSRKILNLNEQTTET